ncbi:MAG: bifunctional homocysteine S-methyltransferase/methylenetetrahydrofolate reductase [Myxococcota bacterium]|nr:bifunctional homocysteine S-methyltransferase/methylenetetrahydrofolate reductase [Myxococcota bacterium]
MKMTFLEAIEAGGLIADGAMGTALYERGIFVNRNFDEVNLMKPELVLAVHREFIAAGANMLETNTYGANPLRLAKDGLADKLETINQTAVSIAREAAGSDAYVCGSIGPTGLSPSQLRPIEESAQAAYYKQAKILSDCGCDALILETFTHPNELRLAVTGARKASDLPIVAQIAVTDEGIIYDNTDPADLAKEMVAWGANVVGANCNGPDEVFQVAVQMLDSGFPVSAMPNAGRPRKVEDRQIYMATPENFGVFARRLYKAGIKIVGGCCGTTPDHVERIAAAARMALPNQQARTQRASVQNNQVPMLTPVPLSKRSTFGSKIGREFIFSVEVNPGGGLNLDRQIKAARMLRDAGADVINIADGPRASARIGNLSFARKLLVEEGIEPLLHLCCRDRNLLGMVSHVLSAHVDGIRNLVCITGDPPKIGDFPNAAAVYDLDSIGLLGMLEHLNSGIDPAGKAMDSQTEFVLATGAEPAALDFEREMDRLEQKVANGANLVMTQPVFLEEHIERFLERSAHLNVPILIGIVPLASSKNAEFLHKNVPGMKVPESIRTRMKAAGTGDDARAEGIAIAIETLRMVRDKVAGAYIMPPLGRYDMAAKIISEFRHNRSLSPAIPGFQSTEAA